MAFAEFLEISGIQLVQSLSKEMIGWIFQELLDGISSVLEIPAAFVVPVAK
jgi:hypothetical protein